jgi:hypothetical protein
VAGHHNHFQRHLSFATPMIYTSLRNEDVLLEKNIMKTEERVWISKLRFKDLQIHIILDVGI